MGQRFRVLNEEQVAFIEARKLFFVGTAVAEKHVNISPKGMDALPVLGPRRVVRLNLTGSGNGTAAHMRHDPCITLMFCAFETAVRGDSRKMLPNKAIGAVEPELPLSLQGFPPPHNIIIGFQCHYGS
jgi:hypothetical protein